ncbi:MAG: UbiX family flavin prenyltransferase [Candidatus Eremiobacteraeota bacterium]|nr:UbiX family flavin prenyltransferase [Candidatus Eremiobacteraeota bacterium]MBV8366979.1 UbiX family flavin prenyltransferase [Candidatus Eremiobacteraeota bacterium]
MSIYIVGITGASGSILGVRALEALRAMPDVTIHLIMTAQAKRTLSLETDLKSADVERLAGVVHDERDLAAAVSSGSFRTDGMLVIPCSMKSAAAIAYSMNDNLLVRAADVCLKERRRLVLSVRETPLHAGHLRTLTRLAELGAVIVPPIAGFYHKPSSVDDIVNHAVGKALDALGVPTELFRRWSGAR